MSLKPSSNNLKNAKVFYRIFPTYKMQWEHVKVLENKKTVFVRYLQDRCNNKNCLRSYWKFETDGIFYNDTQKQVYATVTDGILERVVEGNNVVILNFGQTGCGKTLTASGLNNCYKDRGIALRLITDIFEMQKRLSKKLKMCIQMSYIETKNTYFSDLLSNRYEENLRTLEKVTVVTVKNEYEAMKLLFKAESRRYFTEESLTSHAANGVLTLTVTTKLLYYTNPLKRVAKVHVIDLGGADFYGNDISDHKRLCELSKANLTKTNLEQFMLIMIKNDLGCISVKRRLDVLLQYLNDSFNNHSILRFIGHIRVDRKNLVVTMSMLRFGQLLLGIKAEVLQPRIFEDKQISLLCLEKKLKEMEQEKDLSYMIGCSACNISQDRIQQMQNVALEYLLDKTDEVVICSVTDVTTMLKVFKELYNKLENEKVECTNLAYEKAYKDALMSAPRTDSATSPKIAKRTSKVGKKDNTSNKGSISPKTSPPKNEPIGGPMMSKSMLQDKGSVAAKSVRRSRMSLNIRKKTSSKRKSTSSSDVSPINEATEEDDLALPSTMPLYSEAWTAFANDKTFGYSELEEERLQQEANSKAIQKNYLEEIKALQICFELLDVRKSEYQKAEMMRMFGEQKYDEYGNAITNEYEKQCAENVELARGELINQQEKVLKYQSEFILALKCYTNAKKEVNDKFEEFCQKNYQILVPNLDNVVVAQELEGIDVSCTADDEAPCQIIEKEMASDIYIKLQKYMKEEIYRIKLIRRNRSKKHF